MIIPIEVESDLAKERSQPKSFPIVTFPNEDMEKTTDQSKPTITIVPIVTIPFELESDARKARSKMSPSPIITIPIEVESESEPNTRKRKTQPNVSPSPIRKVPIEIESDITRRKFQSKILPSIFSHNILKDDDRDIIKFGDILLPALSKYFRLRDSPLNDLKYLLAKEHPLRIEGFKREGDKYELKINVENFKPEEIHVKITDRCVCILGEHEEKSDAHNYSRKEFLRKYSLPGEVIADDVVCELSSDGSLLITAPTMKHKFRIEEITIPIRLTGPVRSI